MNTDKHGPAGPATGGAAPGPIAEDGMIHAPFTGDQVASLNNFQLHGMMHPFTCGSEEPHDGPRPALIAGTNGWTCPGRRQGQSCDYHQDWAQAFMADWSWKPHADAVRATLGGTPDPGPIAADDLPWPPWLENLSDEERIEAIVAAVAACAAGHTGPHDDGSAAQHCTVVMAGHFLAKLLPGVSRETPAQALLALAAALDRRADRTGDFGLPRDGSIRARVLREAAGMARDAARNAPGGSGPPGPVPLGTGGGEGGTDALSGTELIAAERQRQITAEGWTPEHDAHHIRGELAQAAACYAWYSAGGGRPVARWPWDERWWKPEGGPVRNLVKAGALIAAEIDRLRAAGEVSP